MSFQIKYVYDLVDKISPQLKTIQSNLQTAASSVNASAATIARSFDKIDQSLKNTGKSFQNAGATLAPLSLAVGGIAVKAFKTAAEFEMLRIRMDVLTGSTEMGAKAFEEVTKYAARTSFGIEDISKSLNMLMSTGGLGFDEAMKSVKVIGDIASISGGEMSGMALAFSQTAGSTKLLGTDFNQFVNNSVPLMKILTDYTGKSTSEIMEMKTAGKLSFDIVSKAMEKATKAGGLFENGAERIAKSLGGLFSILRDDVNLALAQLGSEMAKAINLSQLVKNLSKFASEMTQKFKALSPETKKFITFLVLATTVLAPLLLVLGSLVGILGLAFGGLATLAGGFASFNAIVKANPVLAFIGLMILLYNTWDDFRTVVDFVAKAISGVFTTESTNPFINNLKIVCEWLDKIFEKTKPLKNFFSNAKIIIDAGVEKINDKLDERAGINRAAPINTPQQSLAAGGQLDINLRGLPKGSNTNFTPAPKNFMNVGVNSVYAGAY